MRYWSGRCNWSGHDRRSPSLFDSIKAVKNVKEQPKEKSGAYENEKHEQDVLQALTERQ
jgi:hypothetical protein